MTLVVNTFDHARKALSPMQVRLRPTFRGCYEWGRKLDGAPFALRGVIDQPSAGRPAESLPVFVIEVGGQVVEAWPEEVLED